MRNIGWVCIVLLLGACATMDTGSQTDRTIDFGKYRSYAWQIRKNVPKQANARIDNEIIEGRLHFQINKELQERGLHIDTLAPDLLLDYTVITEQRVDSVQEPIMGRPYAYSPLVPYYGYYSPFYMAPGAYVYGYRTVKNKYEYGKITVYVIDRVQNRLVWQGWADGSVDDVDAFQRDLPKNVESMFRNFPIKKD